MLAYFDSFSGPIPCQVLRIEPRSDCYSGWIIIAKITAGRGPYKRGEIVRSNALHIVPRSSVRIRKYGSRIMPYDWRTEAQRHAFHIDG